LLGLAKAMGNKNEITLKIKGYKDMIICENDNHGKGVIMPIIKNNKR
jgi:hypothetical protein